MHSKFVLSFACMITFAGNSSFALAEAHATEGGMIVQNASASVDDTVAKFLNVLEIKGATVFAVVDHAKGAAKVEMSMPAATLVIFGNPKLGTPMMQAAPDMALELPLKVLFRESSEGKTEIVYRDIRTIAAQNGMPADNPTLGKAEKALAGLTGAVAN